MSDMNSGYAGVIPGFKLVNKLTADGPGEVWQASPERTNQLVVLHFLLLNNSASEKDKERFLREAGNCARLRHPHLVRFLTQGLTENMLWFATEMIEGQNLGEFVAERGSLTVNDAVAIINIALDIIGYLHQENVVHRSLKPASLFVKKELGKFSVQLTDLGSAKCFQSTELRRITNLGERGYRIHEFTAPEALTDFQRLDPRSDIYGLGAILYFMLTGHAPYDIAEDKDLVGAIIETDPPSLLSFKPGLPQPIVNVVERALAREPDARYGTADEMRNALRKVIGAPTKSEPSAETRAIQNKLDRLLIGQEDLKRGQSVIYKQLNTQQQQTVRELLDALQSMRHNEIEADRELREILDAVRRSLIHLQSRQMTQLDTDLRLAVDELAQVLQSKVDLHTGLELAVPLIPLLLNYKISFDAGNELNLSKLWDKLVSRLSRRTKGQVYGGNK